jgi:hypothetical protein
MSRLGSGGIRLGEHILLPLRNTILHCGGLKAALKIKHSRARRLNQQKKNIETQICKHDTKANLCNDAKLLFRTRVGLQMFMRWGGRKRVFAEGVNSRSWGIGSEERVAQEQQRENICLHLQYSANHVASLCCLPNKARRLNLLPHHQAEGASRDSHGTTRLIST